METQKPQPPLESPRAVTPNSSQNRRPVLKQDDCWCEGVGYREESANIDGFFRKLHHFCSCPAGLAAKIEDQQIRAALNITKARALAPAMIEKADVPLRYREFTLSQTPITGPSARVVRDILSALIPESWFFFGSYGVGKTGLAVSYLRHFVSTPALYEQCYQKPKPDALALFRTTPDLLSQLRDCYSSGASEYALIRQVGDVPLLVLDDIGAEHVKDNGWLSDRLYQILNRRNGNGLPTLFTSNVSLDHLADSIQERVTERIMEMCGMDNIVEITGPNLRVKP